MVLYHPLTISSATAQELPGGTYLAFHQVMEYEKNFISHFNISSASTQERPGGTCLALHQSVRYENTAFIIAIDYFFNLCQRMIMSAFRPIENS